jgi:predicted transcriptional regulator
MTRTNWLDSDTELPLIDEKVHELTSFTDAMADGKVDTHELQAQQDRVVQAMKAVESELSDALHAKVTTLLLETTAYDIMRTLHELQAERLRARFK